MSNFRITTDSSCDLPQALAASLNVTVFPLSFTMEDKEYKNTEDISEKDFYDKLRSGAMPKTAAMSMDACMEGLRPFLANGEDVLHIAFSSGLSCTYTNARLAGEELSQEFPDRKVIVIDSLCASLGQGLLVYHAAMARDAGKTIEETAAEVNEKIPQLAHWFTVDDLFHLKRGGRVSAAVAIAGSLLAIKPVMHVDDAGKLVKVTTARGRKASITALLEQMKKTVIAPETQTVFISHGDCAEDAEKLAAMIKETWGVRDVVIGYVGPVIGAHSGAGTLALFFLATER